MGRGSLGGFWTAEEIHTLLESLAVADPHGILTPVDTLGFSHQGRPILALGVADQSRPLGTRPEVLLTARGGGYRLAKPCAEIRVTDILAAVDETVDAMHTGAGASGAISGSCTASTPPGRRPASWSVPT